MPTSNSEDRVTDARELAAQHLEKAKEMALEVASLCEKASRLSRRRGGAQPSILSPKPNAKENKRLRGH